MFYLITGSLGAGKTLNAIAELSTIKDRPIYYVNMKLTEMGKEKLRWCEISEPELQDWQKYEPGCMFIVDEAHKYFPIRSASQKPPAWIEALAEHRSMGLDFYLITQHPMDLDVFVRRRIDRHIHFQRQFGWDRCTRFEWEKLGEPDNDWSLKKASSKIIKFPKSFYKYYESSQKHTVQKRVPKQLYYFIALLLFLGLLFYFLLSILHTATVTDLKGNTNNVDQHPTLKTDPSDKPKTDKKSLAITQALAIPDWLSPEREIYLDGFLEMWGRYEARYLIKQDGDNYLPLSNDQLSKLGVFIMPIDKKLHRLEFPGGAVAFARPRPEPLFLPDMTQEGDRAGDSTSQPDNTLKTIADAPASVAASASSLMGQSQ